MKKRWCWLIDFLLKPWETVRDRERIQKLAGDYVFLVYEEGGTCEVYCVDGPGTTGEVDTEFEEALERLKRGGSFQKIASFTPEVQMDSEDCSEQLKAIRSAVVTSRQAVVICPVGEGKDWRFGEVWKEKWSELCKRLNLELKTGQRKPKP